MPEIVPIPLADLLLDPENPRFGGAPTNEQETALGIADQQGDFIVTLAQDIIDHGLDPTTLPVVFATGDRRKRYRVFEGNRRVLALKALETPSLISPALTASANRKLSRLAAHYEKDPIPSINCVLFAPEEEADARHFVYLRHTGQNEGAGLVPWGPTEKARFEEAHTGKRRPAQQLIDFVETHGELSDAARTSRQGILTNVERMVETTYVREWVGLGLEQGELLALYPAEELLRPLTRIVEDLKMTRVTVPQLYHASDRRSYVDTLPKSLRPKASKKLSTPVRLDDLTSGTTPPRPVTRKPKRPPRRPTRTTVVPRDAQVDVTHPRINSIYYELTTLSAEQYPNACSVLLRVFLELSVDHYLTAQKIPTTQADVLAKRLRLTAEDLEKRNLIGRKLRTAIDTLSSTKTLGPGLATLHQYVHNEHVFPTSADLYATWDTLQPFVEQLWPTR